MANQLKKSLAELFKSASVEFAYLGGSWARNCNAWWSDIDIFVSIPSFKKISPKEQLNLLATLNQEATDLTGYENVEISILETMPLHVQFNVISDGIVIFEKNTDERKQFLEKLLPRYYDHIIWYKSLINQSKYSHSFR